MKVKFIKTLATANMVYMPGHVVDIDRNIATDMRKAGAVEILETASVTQPEKKIMPRGHPKKAYA